MSFNGKDDCCTYFEGEMHHGKHMDLSGLPVGGYTLPDLLRLQTAHGVVFVSRETHFGPQDLRQGYKIKRNMVCVSFSF